MEMRTLGRLNNKVSPMGMGCWDRWQLIENLPHTSFIFLDKAGHNLQIEQDVLFTTAVKEWLERVAVSA